MDPHLEHVLWVAAYAVSSHVMARSTLSVGTGYGEEILTADLSDILTLFNPYQEYFLKKGSSSQVSVKIVDFNKRVEKRVGADFAIVIRGRFATTVGTSTIRKAVLIQAKRQDATALAYAKSTNHVAKARTMIKVAGADDAFFAFYHRTNALTLPHKPSARQQPKFAFSSPVWNGNQQFFVADELSHNVPEVFFEPSFYRRYILGQNRAFDLPPGYDWGIGILPATYFVDASGATRQVDLPPIAHVLQHGASFPDFFVNLAVCRQGTDRSSDADITRLLTALRDDALGEAESLFAPTFAMIVQFDETGAPQDEATMQFNTFLEQMNQS